MSRSWHHGANKPNLFPTALWCPFNFPPVKTAIHGKPGYIPDTYLTPHIGGVFLYRSVGNSNWHAPGL